MSTKPKRFTVRRDDRIVTVYPTTLRGSPVWRFGFREAGGKRRQKTFRTKAAAEESAWEMLGEAAAGSLVWSMLDAEERRFLESVHQKTRAEDRLAVLDFIASRQKSLDLPAAVAAFLEWKVAAKGETAHLAQMRRDLNALAKAMTGKRVADVSLPDLKAWWDERAGEAGKHRKQGIRRTLVSFWLWARKEGLAGNDAATVAERLPSLVLGAGNLRVLTPDELRAILGAVEREWLAWVIFGAFAGIRPEEIAPKGTSKPGLRWEHVDWRFNVIRLPAEASKVRRARVVPLLPAARRWLEWAGAGEGLKGPVCARNPAEEGETLRIGKVLDRTFRRKEGWPADALRHSYGSYRNAMLRNLSKVAEEMGTSEVMLHRHYHNPKTEEEGKAWFAIRPVTSGARGGAVRKATA